MAGVECGRRDVMMVLGVGCILGAGQVWGREIEMADLGLTRY